MFQNLAKRARRRGYPIAGYVGPNGSGKSALAVWDTLPSLEAGRQVLSTVRFLDYANPRECEGCELGEFHDGSGRVHQQAHPLYVPLREWAQIRDAEHCDLFLDEVTGVASSRESHSMPAPIANKLVQMRRRDVVIRWTAPAWPRADKIIRECSQVVNHMTGFLPVTVVAEDGEEQRSWRNRRMFRCKTYDATLFEDFTVGKREQLPALLTDWHYGPKSPAFKAYDTYDAVLSIGTVSDAGRCLDCAGTRKAPECSCPDYAERKSSRASGVAGRRASAVGDAVPIPTPARRPARVLLT